MIEDRRPGEEGGGPGVTMEEYHSDKRTAILNAALTLFTERGFHGTPTSMIAREAGIATGTLFHYFKTKDDLITALYLSVKKEAGAVLKTGAGEEGDWEERMDGAGRAYLAWGLENPEKIRFMQQFCYSPFVSKETHEEGISHFMFFADLIAEGIRAGRIKNYPAVLVLSAISQGFVATILRASAEPDPEKRKEMVEMSTDLIMSGIFR